MKKAFRFGLITLLCALLLVTCAGNALPFTVTARAEAAQPVVAEDAQNAPDYFQHGNWLTADTSASKPVDVFYLYPTAYQKGEGDPNYCAVDNVSMVKGANGAFNRQATAFLPVGNIYAPYYRQADETYILSMPSIADQDEAIGLIPAADAMAAFQYYLDHFNNGRPFILAGHSQGSNVLLLLLSQIKDQPEVYEKMVAAYVIGFSVTQDYLDQNPPLTFATGPDDTHAPCLQRIAENQIYANSGTWIDRNTVGVTGTFVLIGLGEETDSVEVYQYHADGSSAHWPTNERRQAGWVRCLRQDSAAGQTR